MEGKLKNWPRTNTLAYLAAVLVTEGNMVVNAVSYTVSSCHLLPTLSNICRQGPEHTPVDPLKGLSVSCLPRSKNI